MAPKRNQNSDAEIKIVLNKQLSHSAANYYWKYSIRWDTLPLRIRISTFHRTFLQKSMGNIQWCKINSNQHAITLGWGGGGIWKNQRIAF